MRMLVGEFGKKAVVSFITSIEKMQKNVPILKRLGDFFRLKNGARAKRIGLDVSVWDGLLQIL